MIYQQMLSDANVRLEVSETTKTGGKVGGKAAFSYLAWLPFVGSGSASGEVSGEKSSESALQTQFIVQNHEDAQTICTLLKKVGYDRWVLTNVSFDTSVSSAGYVVPWSR